MPYSTGQSIDMNFIGEIMNSMAPMNHASSENIYGASSDSHYGHILFTRQNSSTTHLPSANGEANTGLGLRAARYDHVHPVDASRAPVNHLSTEPEYGAASETEYGHVRLADSTPSSNGVAATGTSSRVAREDHVHPAQNFSGIDAVMLTAYTNTTMPFEYGAWRTVPIGTNSNTALRNLIYGQLSLIEVTTEDYITILQDGNYMIQAMLSTYGGQQRQLQLSVNGSPVSLSPPSGEGESQITLCLTGLVSIVANQQLSLELFNRSDSTYAPSAEASFDSVQKQMMVAEGYKPYMQLSILRLG